MNAFPFLISPRLYFEIGHSSLNVLDGNDGLEVPLDRLENGRLTPSSHENLTLRLRRFLHRSNWRPRPRAFCAIDARGVSLRRLTLPSSTKEELQRLLRLQIESEFPLPPDELAWGYRQLSRDNLRQPGTAATQELIIVAVKREVVEEYSELLSGCGLSPVFTLGAWVRCGICSQPPRAYAVLDIGRSHSELASFEGDAPTFIRVLPWGGEDLTRSIARSLEISRDEAERLKIRGDHEPAPTGELDQQLQRTVRAELDSLAGFIIGSWRGRKLYLTGRSAGLANLAPWLAQALGKGVECEQIERLPGAGRSAAILGLKRAVEQEAAVSPLIIQVSKTRDGDRMSQPARWKWAVLAILLGLGSLSLRYAEALFRQPRLTRKLAAIQVYRERLPALDRELNFLQFLKTNQPPYLDAILRIAQAAPAGARIESLSLNRRGDLSLRGAMRDAQQAVEFRSKLNDSGFFSTVVVEEQTPSADRQKMVVRLSAQWPPARARDSLSMGFPRPESTPSNTPSTSLKSTLSLIKEPSAPVPPEMPPSRDDRK